MRLAQLTRDEEWASIAASQLATIEDTLDHCLDDVIDGAAGAILGLRRIESMAGLPGLSALTARLGEHLERTACRALEGWSWRGGSGLGFRNLTGYAHGASGIAHAFLELFALTGEARWRFAASRAMSYERHHEIAQSGDWPDHRSSEMMYAIGGSAPAPLRDRLRSGEFVPPAPPTVPRVARLWCHGAPGIALTRIRAVFLGVDETETRSELFRALGVSREALSLQSLDSHCLCHGLFGVLETLFIARECLGIGDGGVIDSTVERALSKFGGGDARWLSGAVGGQYDPSLLLGEAGVGHAMLRLAGCHVPSVLCISSWDSPPACSGAGDESHRYAELKVHLPRALCATQLLPPSEYQRAIEAYLSSSASIEATVTAIRNTIESTNANAEVMLRDALSVDAALLDANADFTDFIGQYCHEVARYTFDEVDVDAARVVLAPHACVVSSRWAWSEQSDDQSPPLADEFFLLHRSLDTVRLQPVTELQAAIFMEMTNPARLKDIEVAILGSIDAEPSVLADIPDYIRQTVQQAVASGAADLVM
jgi:hypothetical protein